MSRALVLLTAFLDQSHLKCTKILFKISHVHVDVFMIATILSGEDGRRTIKDNSNVMN